MKLNESQKIIKYLNESSSDYEDIYWDVIQGKDVYVKLNETAPYGFEEFIDYNDGKYDVKPGALDEVREKLLGAALLLWYMYEDKDIPNKEKLQEIHDKIEEAADEIYNLNQGEE